MVVTVALSPGERLSLSLESETATQISVEILSELKEASSRPQTTDQGVCIFQSVDHLPDAALQSQLGQAFADHLASQSPAGSKR